jgi:hypothetical protein
MEASSHTSLAFKYYPVFWFFYQISDYRNKYDMLSFSYDVLESRYSSLEQEKKKHGGMV